MCKQSDLESPAFQVWIRQLYENPEQIHRKLWVVLHSTSFIRKRDDCRWKKGIGFEDCRRDLPLGFNWSSIWEKVAELRKEAQEEQKRFVEEVLAK